ncbi:unnamed protein product [Ilex paraguariensis]|uniref:Uncharacterized protein n=1 Tax=Ilex paraguariensis TaxID=185542 RepID=A0ABC8UIK5_9AQUA
MLKPITLSEELGHFLADEPNHALVEELGHSLAEEPGQVEELGRSLVKELDHSLAEEPGWLRSQVRLKNEIIPRLRVRSG